MCAGSSFILRTWNRVCPGSKKQLVLALTTCRCTSQAFRDEKPGRAADLMLECVLKYFASENDQGKERRVHRTSLAPIYFQRQGKFHFLCACRGLTRDSGHSLTIVGVENKEDGEVVLIVFDPAHRDTTVIKDMVGKSVRQLPSSASRLLRPYRCNHKNLRRYKEFELLLYVSWHSVPKSV